VIEVQVSSQSLKVVLTGKDAWLYATRPLWEIEVPLEHVRQVIDLDGDPFGRMTLSVPDPEDTVEAITGALRLRNR
jgi:hypothetical protein